ncbi:PREDICTED: EPIDERMAL PATTERNING FACTOR-like protein 4 [Camelina sativa]|uniref:Epidermal patterning factor-like protein n=1 Tax=Camelina sativa TaxID=90675 RepID=A0ABM0UFI9_CAMSA|nr:PREDICTED: EPIDERMAL PATTERNING FACTOR-like protein 4 [Camelina sativa]XP_010440405.1 PREDICTED: EPIDERMAL PATTERNING FACTOR-like protein 4 [Camelina sativa]
MNNPKPQTHKHKPKKNLSCTQKSKTHNVSPQTLVSLLTSAHPRRFLTNMGASRRRRRRFLLAALAAFALLHLFSVSADGGWIGRQRPGSGLPGGFIGDNKRFGGPGSSPPTCRAKCKRCQPCKPVHVPIQPGLSMPLEYYPEAWRCKCGNNLFMP